MEKTVNIFGLSLPLLTDKERSSVLCELIKNGRGASMLTPNVEILRKAEKDTALHACLRQASLLLPDGIGVYLAARLLGAKQATRSSGIDAAEELLHLCEQSDTPLYLLGGRYGVAEAAAKRLRAKHPRLTICGCHHGYFSLGGEEDRAVCEDIRDTGAQVVFVCLGCPKQETWIERHRHELPCVHLLCGLGGSLDVWAGEHRRAPVLWQEAGLEWLWRSLSEPRRLAILPHFLAFFFKILIERCHPKQVKPPLRRPL